MLPAGITPIDLNKFLNLELVRIYKIDNDEQIRIWSDATVDLLDKDLNRLQRVENDPSELDKIVKKFDDIVKSKNSDMGVEKI